MELVHNVVQARVPIIGEHVMCQALDDGVYVVTEHGRVVSPGGYYPSRPQDAADLRVEPAQVEPVDRGSHRNQVHGAGVDARILRLGDPVFDPRLAGAWSVISALSSVAMTRSKYRVRCVAAWPLRVAQSQATSREATVVDKKVNNSLG
ncbi:MAG: hypothetical protein K0S10_852 [Rubrobacteraceae bacterium]|jgi:hypothetical protein|nr:hypothetical protein [Rubrobacteraceae bacterium]